MLEKLGWITQVSVKAMINIYKQSSLQNMSLSFISLQWKTSNNGTNDYIVPKLSSISNKENNQMSQILYEHNSEAIKINVIFQIKTSGC